MMIFIFVACITGITLYINFLHAKIEMLKDLFDANNEIISHITERLIQVSDEGIKDAKLHLEFAEYVKTELEKNQKAHDLIVDNITNHLAINKEGREKIIKLVVDQHKEYHRVYNDAVDQIENLINEGTRRPQ